MGKLLPASVDGMVDGVCRLMVLRIDGMWREVRLEEVGIGFIFIIICYGLRDVEMEEMD